MTDGSRLTRLLRLVAIVVARPGLSSIELAAALGVSERTLSRDLDDLRALGVEVLSDEGYRVQERLPFEGSGPSSLVTRVYDHQLALLLSDLGPDRVEVIRVGVEAAVPEALTAMVSRALPRAGAVTPEPMLLFSTGNDDADFLYATGFRVEEALYIRFADGADVLAVAPLELDRARLSSRAHEVVDAYEAIGSSIAGNPQGWAGLAASLLSSRAEAVRVSARLPVAYFQALERAGISPRVDPELLVLERRCKSASEAESIRAAQRAAEAACVSVMAELGAAQIVEGRLELDDEPLTAERLKQSAWARLRELGHTCDDIIVAGGPQSAIPHDRGSGPIPAHAPVIIDVFPRGIGSRYHGDLTRTVIRGEISAQARDMHAAVLAALEKGIATIRAGVSARDVHRAVCQALVDGGYGTVTTGLEGPEGVARMIHATGHGIGLEVHEAPGIRDRDEVLRRGDVVTIEPGLYLEGWGGIRIEDAGMVTDSGFENFTTLARALTPTD